MISLIIGLSFMTTSSIGMKSTISSAKSVNSFQVADSGIEYAFREVREFRWNETGGNEGDKNLEDENTDGLGDVFNLSGECDNSTGKVSGSANGGTFELFFYPDFVSTTPINNCNGNNANIVRIKKIKAVGTYKGITRSVEATADFSGL